MTDFLILLLYAIGLLGVLLIGLAFRVGAQDRGDEHR